MPVRGEDGASACFEEKLLVVPGAPGFAIPFPATSTTAPEQAAVPLAADSFGAVMDENRMLKHPGFVFRTTVPELRLVSRAGPTDNAAAVPADVADARRLLLSSDPDNEDATSLLDAAVERSWEDEPRQVESVSLSFAESLLLHHNLACWLFPSLSTPDRVLTTGTTELETRSAGSNVALSPNSRAELEQHLFNTRLDFFLTPKTFSHTMTCF